jgi:hypothetical protein
MSEQTTLRDQLSAAFDAAPEVDQVTEGTKEAAATGTEGQQVDAQTASDRARDKQGRFAPRAGEGQQAQTNSQAQGQPGQELQAQGEGQLTKQRPPRPSTWKKDIAERFWDQMDPDLADYLNLREQQYAQGVSTYKQEWERVKPISEALSPYLPLLQQHGVDPAQWISSLAEAQRTLAFGSPEQKAAMFQRLAMEYGVPLGEGGDSNVSAFVRELQQLKSQWNHFQTAQQRAAEEGTRAEIAKWSDGKPHFAKVRETMAQLLEASVANDLDDAYDKAIRLHDDIFSEVQQERARAAEEERRQRAAQTVAQARANAVSVKGATPSSPGKAAPAKGLRAQLEAAAEEHMSSRY